MDLPPPSRQSRIHFLPSHAAPPRRPSPLNPTSRRFSLDSAPRTRRVPSSAHMVPSPTSSSFAHVASASGTNPLPGVFSDEYDLYPRILHDVQRALKLKAKREASLRRRSLDRPTSSKADYYLPPSISISSSNAPRGAIATVFPEMENVSISSGSDVDFAPAVGNNVVVDGHPVPCSSDNGTTLDWSGISPEFDKRWSLPIKRKGKSAVPHLNILVQQQEKVYSERLEKIRMRASRSTLQKASITKDQLTRRYKLLNNPSSSHDRPLRLTDIARWYESQEPSAKTAMEGLEPPAWLKHLQKKRNRSVWSPWQLTASTMEEYVRVHDGHTIPYPANEYTTTDVLSQRSLSPPGITLVPVASRGSSRVSFDPSIPRKSSFEGLLSFEPLTRSARGSLDILSRRSAESGYSSPGSKSSNFPDVMVLNGKRWSEGLSARLQRRLTRENEVITPSTQNSLEVSEQDFYEEEAIEAGVDHRGKAESLQHGIKVIVTAGSDSKVGLPRSEESDSALETGIDTSYSQLGQAPSSTADHRLAPWIETRREKSINQERMKREYEAKALLLEEATAQNYTIRQLLTRISIVIKEYEVARVNALVSLGNHHQLQRLPRELLEAFSHDPAAVTGPTRRLRGWRAVDDIHNRLVKQRAICREFLSEHVNGTSPEIGSMLEDLTKTLKSSLESLEQCKAAMQFKAKDVGELLKEVQDIHTNVKTNYNDALSHTSVVYPELSVIVALEESYKDQYQQIWDIGMDALAFVLDSVTPFWRTYGKTIGEDIRDFLIIPLYRNEFTGEAKRYPITHAPKRSLRHWLGLCLLCFLSITVTLLQTRVAITSVMHSGLRYIPYESIRWTMLPFFWVMIVIQWSIVLAEFAFLLSELAVILWWAGWSIKVFT
ncbi:hypothetical protein AX15_001568 [Amanita polypyramis BW_CC]|nr:hypothetical protein AX15_001568 [Amanita polypyramis BW_CC]